MGEVTDEIIFGNVTLFQGFAAIGVVALRHLANSWGSFLNETIERLTGSTATVIVRDGQMVESGLMKERMSEEELWSELRLQEIEELAEVKQAAIEPNRQVSVLRQEWAEVDVTVWTGSGQRVRFRLPLRKEQGQWRVSSTNISR